MRIHLLLSLTAALLLAAAPGFAQADLEATVPFDFFAGKSVLPAGNYTLDIDNVGMVWIHNTDSRSRSVVGTIGVGGGPNDGNQSKLVFHRHGDRHYLAELWVAGRSSGREIKRTPREDETARNQDGAKVTILASSR